MKHLTLGTAGHVDHGKTALIRRLTGVDCDTHKQEKERGITINLGFAYLAVASGYKIGIVDVPGHKDFIHTMTEGAMGIDIGLLVIAASEGVMPQTREHVDIMNMLGITCGLTVLTKSDLMDEPTLADVESSTRNYLNETFLRDAPLLKVSSVTGDGVESLIAEIDRIAQNVHGRPSNGPFRMFVDRVFSKPGFGAIVTGSALSGQLKNASRVYLLPESLQKARIRNIERFGEQIDSVSAGDRTAINLSGVHVSDLKRGMVISDRVLCSTTMVDTRLTMFSGNSLLRSRSDVMFHAGSYSLKAGVHVLDCDSIRSGDSGFVQMIFNSPCVLRYGDRFIVRSSSGDQTLGGGCILNAQPLHHKRRRESVTKQLRAIEDEGVVELVAQAIKTSAMPVSLGELASSFNFSELELIPVVRDNLSDGIVSHESGNEIVYLSDYATKVLSLVIVDRISLFHKTHPYENHGLSEHELLAGLKLGNISVTGKQWVLQYLLSVLSGKDAVKAVEKTWAIESLLPADNVFSQSEYKTVAMFLEECGEKLKVPSMEEWNDLSNKLKISDKDLKQILFSLVKDGVMYRVESSYLHSDIVNDAREVLVDYLNASAGGITVAEFRDLIHGNRKVCLAMLSIFDAEGTTKRDGNYRLLVKK